MTDIKTEQNNPPPDFYGHTMSYADEHGETRKYMASRRIDIECKEAIEETIRQNFDGIHLKSDIVKPLAEQYGSERMTFVLANTLQKEMWDERYSGDNKAWASEFPISENIIHGIDMNRELIVSGHSAVLDGFIDMFRTEVLGHEEVLETSGHHVQKLETGQSEQNEPKQASEIPKLEDINDGDEIIDLGDDKAQVLSEMKKFLAGEQEPKSIFSVKMYNEERFYENTSGLDVEALCKAYSECGKPFVEMGQYGKQISEADFAYIQQGDKLSFSVEFDADNDEIVISDGEHFEQKGLTETLFTNKEESEKEVTLTVAECGEFHNLGALYENIPTVDEAIAIWKQIPPERMNGIPAIGINIHTPGTDAMEDVEMDILSGERFDLDILEYSPEIKENPRAMEVITELIAKLPDFEIDGSMSEEMEAKVWEKRMPDLIPAQQLAFEIDRFTFDYDAGLYHTNIQNMTKNVSELAEAIEQGDASHITTWLADVITEGTEPEETRRAMELLEKLTEYKPLAKIEDNAINGMDEQNYNMVDDVLNNGAGEKTGKEENKKEQKHPTSKTSLKTRLAEKKTLISSQGKAQGTQKNIKKIQKEITE